MKKKRFLVKHYCVLSDIEWQRNDWHISLTFQLQPAVLGRIIRSVNMESQLDNEITIMFTKHIPLFRCNILYMVRILKFLHS